MMAEQDQDTVQDFFARWEAKKKAKRLFGDLADCIRLLSQVDKEDLEEHVTKICPRKEDFNDHWTKDTHHPLASSLYFHLREWLNVPAASARSADADTTAATTPAKRARPDRIELEPIPSAASGLGPSGSGLNASLGYMGESVTFIPHGVVRDKLWHAAVSLADTDPRVQSVAHTIFDHLVCKEQIRRTVEEDVSIMWTAAVSSWLPSGGDGNWRHSYNTPAATSVCAGAFGLGVNNVDYSLSFRFRCLLVAELKNSTFSTFEALSQAALGGAAAALALFAAGVPLEHCVVPVVAHTGLLEQHGAVFLIEHSTPVYVALSPVLDLVASSTRLVAAKFRVAAAQHVQRMAADFLDKSHLVGALALPAHKPAFSLAAYFVKTPKLFFGKGTEGSAALTVLHELGVFERLAVAGVEGVVYPVAHLMKHVDASTSTWHSGGAMVYPNIAPEGYASGFVHDARWREAVTAAIASVHRAGVVHMDLWPCNIMSKKQDDGTYRVKLVDFEASLAVGEAVPSRIADTIAQNGCRRIYHPGFVTGAVADRKFDLWFVAAFALFSQRGVDPAVWTRHGELGDFCSAHQAELLARVAAMCTADS